MLMRVYLYLFSKLQALFVCVYSVCAFIECMCVIDFVCIYTTNKSPVPPLYN